MDAVTNYQNLSELKQDRFILLQLCMLQAQNMFCWTKIKVWAELCSFFGGSRGESISLPFLAFRSHPHSLTHGTLSPSSKPERLYLLDCFTLVISLFLWTLLEKGLLFLVRMCLHWAYLDNPGDSLHLKDINLIISAKSLLPCEATYFQVPEIRVWTSLGIHYSANCSICASSSSISQPWSVPCSVL